jgi:hypothetical protein
MTRREPVEMRQRLPVHLMGNDRVFVERLPHRDAFDEIRGPVEHRAVGAVDDDLDRLLAQSRLGEHVLEPNAAPDRIAHRAGPPLHPRHMRLRPSAAVAGALAHSGDLDLLEPCLQLIKGQLQRRRRSLAADLQPPAIGIDLVGDIGEVIADEERVVGCDRGSEVRHRRLVIGRPVAQLDQRLFARKRVEDRGVVNSRRKTRNQRVPLLRPCRPPVQSRLGEGQRTSTGPLQQSPSA